MKYLFFRCYLQFFASLPCAEHSPSYCREHSALRGARNVAIFCPTLICRWSDHHQVLAVNCSAEAEWELLKVTLRRVSIQRWKGRANVTGSRRQLKRMDRDFR